MDAWRAQLASWTVPLVAPVVHSNGGVLNRAVYGEVSGAISGAALHHLAITSEVPDLQATRGWRTSEIAILRDAGQPRSDMAMCSMRAYVLPAHLCELHKLKLNFDSLNVCRWRWHEGAWLR